MTTPNEELKAAAQNYLHFYKRSAFFARDGDVANNLMGMLSAMQSKAERIAALSQQGEQQPVAFFPPLPHSVLRCGQTVVYDAMQMHQYAVRFADTAAPAPQTQDCKCKRLGDFDGTKHHPLCDSAPAPQPAQEKRPINCGTGHCSCVECHYEQSEKLA